MIVVSERSISAFRAVAAADIATVLARRLRTADPLLVRGIPETNLDALIRKALADCETLGLQTEGSVLLYATLEIGAHLHPQPPGPFAEPIGIMRNLELAPSARQELALAYLTDLDQSMPPELRDISTFGTPELDI